MNTPICDFVQNYRNSNALRLHMPGHKGKNYIGMEELDITEIDGADSLFEASGIIRESEQNASELFGTDTFYSTEGSSLCIHAMLYLALLDVKNKSERPIIFAGRNAHKAFITAAALLDFDVEWIYGDEKDSYLSCNITDEVIENKLKTATVMPTAVYLTSPDYLGNMTNIEAVSKVCHKYGVRLLVDNAHGAYLKFLPTPQHPIDLGADMCCDSAHKSLPVLTGGAYLHISKTAPQTFKNRAKDALGLFASSSPSYLILQSLDAVNRYIADEYSQKLLKFMQKVGELKKKLAEKGLCVLDGEPMKLTIATKVYGYTGIEFAKELAKENVICEFCDADFVVLMPTPEIGDEGLDMLEKAITAISKRMPICEKMPHIPKTERIMSIREACFAGCEEVSVGESVGRIFANINVSCPPAVPIVVCGERINERAIECLKYYGTENCLVVKE